VRILVSADMEGVTGVVHPDDVEPGTAAYAECRHLMTADVNAAVAGLFDGGATEVVVNDAHYTMRNLVLAELDPRVEYIRGSTKPLGMMQGLLDDEGRPVDSVAFVGYHAGAGQPGVLAHCHLANSIVDVRVGGVSTSEGRMNAMLAASLGVPVVLVTGDDVACADADTYAPLAARAQVKQAVDRYAAKVLPPARTAALIRDAAARGLFERSVPQAPVGPFSWEVELDAAHLARAASRAPGVEPSGPRSVVFDGPDFLSCFQTFRLVAILVGGAALPEWG
jgi:D-amino peptidase